MNLHEIESRIRAACKAVQAQGWRIMGGKTVNHAEKRCCPLGACAIVDDLYWGGVSTLGLELGISPDVVGWFIIGFEDEYVGPVPEIALSCHEMGQRLRVEFGAGRVGDAA